MHRAPSDFLSQGFLNRDRCRPKNEAWTFHNAFQIKNESEDLAEISILDEISFWGIDAVDVVNQLEGISASTIKVTINSPGGDVFDGIAIFNVLQSSKAKIVVDVIGVAGSIASVIAMAGDQIIMRPNARMMIHNPWTFALGDATDLRSTANLLDNVKDDIITTYRTQSSLSKSKISNLMDDETWMSAEETVENGFATEIYNSSEDDKPDASSFDNKVDTESNLLAADARQRELELLQA